MEFIIIRKFERLIYELNEEDIEVKTSKTFYNKEIFDTFEDMIRSLYHCGSFHAGNFNTIVELKTLSKKEAKKLIKNEFNSMENYVNCGYNYFSYAKDIFCIKKDNTIVVPFNSNEIIDAIKEYEKERKTHSNKNIFRNNSNDFVFRNGPVPNTGHSYRYSFRKIKVYNRNKKKPFEYGFRCENISKSWKESKVDKQWGRHKNKHKDVFRLREESFIDDVDALLYDEFNEKSFA